MDNVVKFGQRVFVQIVTVARFRRPDSPRKCRTGYYHVWRWNGGPQAPEGLRCQCGLLADPPRMPN